VVVQVLDARDPEGCRCRDVERAVRASGAHKRVVLLLNKADLVPRAALEAWLARLRLELPTVAFKASTQQQAAGLGQRAGGVPSAGGGGSKRRGAVGGGPAAQAAAAAAAAADGAVGAGALGAACLGADTLLQLIKNYARNAAAGTGGGKGGGASVRQAVTVGIVGLPNVGKSSVINSLRRARVVAVGDTPGMTRTAQIVQLDKHIRLVDSPGVVFAGIGGGGVDGGEPGEEGARAAAAAAAALRNAARVEKLDDPIAPVAEIVRRVPAKRLMALYRVPAFDAAIVEAEKAAAAADKAAAAAAAAGKSKKTKGGAGAAAAAALAATSASRIPHEAYVAAADRFLQLVAQARGKLRRGGVPDSAAAARLVLGDWCAGRIPYYTLPPPASAAALASAEDAAHESAQIVSGWSAEFDAERVFADERRVVLERLAPAPPSAAAAAGGDGFDGGLLGGEDDDAAAVSGFVEVAAAAGAPRMDAATMEESQEEDEDEEEEEEESDAMEGDSDDEDGGLDAATAALLARRQRAAEGGAAGQAAQRAQLYAAQGQRDPHALRAEKKRQRRVRASLKGLAADDGGDDDGSDFEFGEAGAVGRGEYGEGPAGGKDADEAYLDRMEGADDDDE